MAPVKIYDDRNGSGRFCCCDGDDENCKENSVEPVGPNVFIEGDKVQVHTVQHQFNTHQHGNQVPPGEESVHSDKEECGADEEYMVKTGLQLV